MTMNVYEKLNLAREMFHASKIKKSGQNKFAGYEYFELADFTVPAMQIFKQVGLSGFVSFGKDMAVLRIVNCEKPEEVILIESPMSEANLKGCHPVQNLGAVQTYLRRYLWVAALEIVEHDALDATTGKKGPGPVVTPRGGIGEELPDDVKEFLTDIAMECVDLVSKGQALDAYNLIKSNKLDSDQEVWLANRLDSKTRAAIKAAKS